MKSSFSISLPSSAAMCIGFAALLDSINKFDPISAEWRRRYAYRLELKRLLKVGPHMAHDIGLSPEEALREIEKPIWKS